MKVNRDLLVEGGLKLLDEVGLEKLTLRLLGKRLDVQAPAIYWHFGSKAELLDAMATELLARGASGLLPANASAAWPAWAEAFGAGLRRALLGHRDGAKMVAGTRLTGSDYMRAAEQVAGALVGAGFTLREAVTLLGAIYCFTVSFVQEEQEVYPLPGERSSRYDLAEREVKLRAQGLPLLAAAGEVLFEGFEKRFHAGLELIVLGAEARRNAAPARR
jgi:TetR/AcrR family transcriptional regulator, tetracycline repressor protein